MGDLDAALNVRTRFETAEALLGVIGSALTRGALRVPIRISLGRPFELVLSTRGGDETVRGSAEEVAHDGHATWIRFLSAGNAPAKDGARIVLDDVELAVRGTLLERAAKAADPEAAAAAVAVIALVERAAALRSRSTGKSAKLRR
jgi:hypothetical protein